MWILLLVSSLLLPTVAYGQGNVVTFPTSRFPSHTTVVLNGERHETFDLGGFVGLLRLDSDLYYAQQELELLRQYRAECDATVLSLRTGLDLSNHQLEISTNERNRLFHDWEQENLARRQAENKPRLGSWLGWSLASGFALSTIITTALLIVKIRN